MTHALVRLKYCHYGGILTVDIDIKGLNSAEERKILWMSVIDVNLNLITPEPQRSGIGHLWGGGVIRMWKVEIRG